jgi:hypothetical protein
MQEPQKNITHMVIQAKMHSLSGMVAAVYHNTRVRITNKFTEYTKKIHLNYLNLTCN